MLQLGQLSERKVWLAWCCSFKCCTFSNKKCQMNLPSSEKKRFCLPDGRFGKRTNFSVPKCDPFFGLLAWCCSFQCCALPAQIRSIQEKRAKSSFFRFACLVLQLVGVAATVESVPDRVCSAGRSSLVQNGSQPELSGSKHRKPFSLVKQFITSS